MAIQTQTFKQRLRAHSGLSPQARLVALVIADMRYEKRKRHNEPLPLTGAQLAAECGMSERTLDRYLNECIASGWVVGRKVYRDGRQRAHEWFVLDATDEAECRRLRTEIASQGQILCAGVAGIPRRRLHSVLRSKNNGADDDAAPRGGGGSDEQESQNPEPQAPPVPAQPQAAEPDGAEPETRNPQLEERSEPATDAAVFAQWDAEVEAAGFADLANPPVIPKHRDPLSIPCPECNVDVGERCPGFQRGQHLRRRLAVYGLAAS